HPHNQLLVEWATDCSSGQLRYEHGSGPEDATFGAANVLPIDKETRVALCQFDERLIDGSEHRRLALGPARGVLAPLRNMQNMMQDTISRWLRLLEYLSLDTVQFGTHFFTDAVYITFLHMTMLNKP